MSRSKHSLEFRAKVSQEYMDGAGSIRFLADKYGAVIDFIDVPELPYSSTDIRKKVAMGLSVKEDVGEEVEEYIKSRKLYV